MQQHRWMIGVTTSASLLGLTVTSGLVFLANRIVNEFSHPHIVLDERIFDFILPGTVAEPAGIYQHPLLIQTSDSKLLQGEFWAQPHLAPTVVMCHGYRASRTHLRPAAALEYSLGYNVLLFDFRGHGASESVITSGGNAEVHDLEAAIAAACMQPETLPHKIILHGFSMGAAIALLTAPHPDVIAIVADSPFARSDEVLRRLVKYRLTSGSTAWRPFFHRLRTVFPAVAWMTVATCVLIFRMRFGHTFVARPDTTFKRLVARIKKDRQLHSVPILLIHASGDELIPFTHAHQLVARAQKHAVPLETYFVDSPSHCGAYAHNPEKYVAVTQDFLARCLQGDFPNGQQALQAG